MPSRKREHDDHTDPPLSAGGFSMLRSRSRYVAGAAAVLTLVGLIALATAVAPLPSRVEPAAGPSPTEAPGATATPEPALGAPIATFVVIVSGPAVPIAPTAEPIPRTPTPLGSAAEPARPTATLILPAQSGATGTLVVANAGPDGVSIRKEPGTGERIRVWKDDTGMTFLGEERQAAGRLWKRVRDPEGNEGWVAAEFLAEISPAAPAGATSPQLPTRVPAEATANALLTATPPLEPVAPPATPIAPLATPIAPVVLTRVPTTERQRTPTQTPARAPTASGPGLIRPGAPLPELLPRTTAGPTAPRGTEAPTTPDSSGVRATPTPQ